MSKHTPVSTSLWSKRVFSSDLTRLRHLFILLIFLVSMVGVPAIQVDAAVITFTGEELLGRPTDTSITVNVVPDTTIELFYEYGIASGDYTDQTLNETATGGVPHDTLISGLQPDTLYYYRMQYRTAGDEWVPRAEHSFHTQRAPGSSFTFTVTSDGHVNIILGSATTWTNTLNDVAADHPDFEIDLGDTVAMDDVTNATEADDVYKDVLPFFNDISASTPIFLVPGNHEQQEGWHLLEPLASSLPVIGTNAQKKYFLNPVPDAFYTGDTDPYSYLDGDHLREDYYAWTWGDALFVVIDPYWFSTTKPYVTDPGGGEDDTTGSGDSWDWTLGLQQFNWLRTTLENSTAKYKFVFSHQMVGGGSIAGQADYGHGGANYADLVEWGGYNEDGSTWGWNTHRNVAEWGSEPVHQIMVNNGVSAFFHGHDHQYAYEMLDGIVYQAVPSSGFSGNGFSIYTTGDGNTIQALPSSGHLKVTVTPSLATVDYIQTSQTTPAYSYYIAAAGATFDLTTAVDPAGSGTITPEVGTHSYTAGSVVDVTASPNAGYVFDHWSGACTGSGPCQVTLDDDKTVTAHFVTYVPGSIVHVGDIGSVKSTSDGTTMTIDVTNDIPVGDTIIIGIASRGNPDLEYSVSDSATGGSNTYSEAVQSVSYTHGRAYIFYTFVERALHSGDTITITNSPAVSGRVAVVSVFRGLILDSLDQALGYPTSEDTALSSTTPSVGPVTTTQDYELVFGAIGTEGPLSDNPGTWQNSFTPSLRDGTSGATYDWTVSTGFRIVSSTGDYTAAKTGITQQYWASTIATFKGQAVVPNMPPVVSDIPDQTIAEGASFATINLDNYVSDVDNTDAEMTWSASGATDLSVSITNRVATISVPNADWNGSETITFRATDPEGLYDEDDATFTVTAVNDAPVAVDDTYTAVEGTTLNVPAPGVLSNDSDIDGDPMTAVKLSDPSHGVVTLNPDGSFSYTPTALYNGPDSFTYKANDGTVDSNTATVHINVGGVNNAPVCTAASLTTAEDTSGEVAPACTDADGDTLSYSIVTQPSHGSASVVAGMLRYTSTSNYNGSDSFTYQASDGTLDSNAAAVSVTVTPVNDAPVLAAIGDKAVNELVLLSFSAQATDVDGDVLTFTLDSGAPAGATIQPASGLFSWTPTEAQGPGSYPVTIRVSDGLASDFETITITVAEVNQAPVASDDIYTTKQDTPLSVLAGAGVLANDSDSDGDTIAATLVASPATGVLVLNSDGSFTYTPQAGFFGSVTFSYRAHDGQMYSEVAQVRIDITPAGQLFLPIIQNGS